MNRREILGVTASAAVALSGCSGPSASNEPTGEITFGFETRATEPYTVEVRLVDSDGETAESFEETVSPDQSDQPTFSATDLSNGPYEVELETTVETVNFEWSEANCVRLDVTVIILKDGRIEFSSQCTA